MFIFDMQLGGTLESLQVLLGMNAPDLIDISIDMSTLVHTQHQIPIQVSGKKVGVKLIRTTHTDYAVVADLDQNIWLVNLRLKRINLRMKAGGKATSTLLIIEVHSVHI